MSVNARAKGEKMSNDISENETPSIFAALAADFPSSRNIATFTVSLGSVGTRSAGPLAPVVPETLGTVTKSGE